jgi:hypothetical protein
VTDQLAWIRRNLTTTNSNIALHVKKSHQVFKSAELECCRRPKDFPTMFVTLTTIVGIVVVLVWDSGQDGLRVTIGWGIGTG